MHGGSDHGSRHGATAAESTRVDLSADPESPRPGEDTTLTFRITDQATGRPVGDAEDTMTLWYDIRGSDGEPAVLEDYLGAKMHIVTWSFQGLRYVHAHPGESGPKGEKVVLTFPVEERYKIFGQFRADGRVVTTEFVVDVAEHPPHKLPGL